MPNNLSIFFFLIGFTAINPESAPVKKRNVYSRLKHKGCTKKSMTNILLGLKTCPGQDLWQAIH